ncbi:unnamed protein product [Urochloa humidicola]
MERGCLAMAAFGSGADTMERSLSSSSRSSSGCLSGWTLYLDHSNNNGVRCVPRDPAAHRWSMLLQQADDHADDGDMEDDEEDSMASDASSGPRPCLREEDDDARWDFEHRLHEFVVDQRGRHSTTTSGGGTRGSSCFGGSSTWSRRSSQQAGGVSRTTAAVLRADATSTRQNRREVIVIDDDGDDELDDTASSSAVFSCPSMPMLHAR